MAKAPPPKGPKRQKGKTHFPHMNGPACGLFPPPTDARDYSVTDPTCEWCAYYLDNMQAHSDTYAPAPAPAADDEQEEGTRAPERVGHKKPKDRLPALR